MSLGLVLSGGGALGAFEAGVVAALEEAGVEPAVLSGTSAGALNVAAVAHGLDAAALADLWRSTLARDIYRVRRDVWRLLRPAALLGRGHPAGRALAAIGWSWLMDTGPLRATLRRALGGEEIAVRDGLAVVVSAVEVLTGQLVRFANRLPPEHRRTRVYREVALGVDHLMASAAIPLLFRPAAAGGVAYWDGGLVANTPLAPALDFEPERVMVVTTSTRTRPAPPPRNLAEAASLLVDNVLSHSLTADIKHARAINELCRLDPGHGGYREVDLLVVEPVGLELGGSLEFGRELAEQRLALGLDAGRRALESWT